MNLIINPELACKATTAGGVLKVWLNARSRFGRFWYYRQTERLQYGEITGHSGTYNNWYPLDMRTTDGELAFDQENDGLRLYPVTLKLNFNAMDIPHRDMIEQMVVAQDAIFVVLDRNSRYWLVGETLGCQIDWQAQTGQRSGVNQYSITATARERYPIRQLAQSYVDTYVNPPVAIGTVCETDIDSLCGLTFEELKQLPLQ